MPPPYYECQADKKTWAQARRNWLCELHINLLLPRQINTTTLHFLGRAQEETCSWCCGSKKRRKYKLHDYYSFISQIPQPMSHCLYKTSIFSDKWNNKFIIRSHAFFTKFINSNFAYCQTIDDIKRQFFLLSKLRLNLLYTHMAKSGFNYFNYLR